VDYLLKKGMEMHGNEKNDILNFFPDGAIIFKDLGSEAPLEAQQSLNSDHNQSNQSYLNAI
jgi:hypothetical protein